MSKDTKAKKEDLRSFIDTAFCVNGTTTVCDKTAITVNPDLVGGYDRTGVMFRIEDERRGVFFVTLIKQELGDGKTS